MKTEIRFAANFTRLAALLLLSVGALAHAATVAGTVTNKTTGKPSAVLLWQGSNPKARDFRVDSIGKAFTSTPLQPAADGTYVADVPKPVSGFTATIALGAVSIPRLRVRPASRDGSATTPLPMEIAERAAHDQPTPVTASP